MGLRLFVAIELPEVVLDALRGIQDQLKGRAGAELVRWVEPEELRALAMPPADAPLVDVLIARLGSN